MKMRRFMNLPSKVDKGRRLLSGLYVMAAVLALPIAAAAQADGAKPPKRRDDPKAMGLLEEVAQAYKALPSYSDQGEFGLSIAIGGQPRKQSLPMKLIFVRPNKLKFDAGQVTITSDGKTLTTSVVPLKRYTKADAPKQITMDSFKEGPLGAILFGGPSGPPMMVLLNLLTAVDPAATLSELGGTLKLGVSADAKKPVAPGRPVSPTLLIDFDGDRPDILLTVDPATKLLSGIDLKFDPETLAKSGPGGQPIEIEKFGWTSGLVSTKPVKDEEFAFVAPAGSALVDALIPKQEEKASDDAKLGKPAPDFTLTVLDGPGKTRTITKAELKGKVVVIDFWATWCGPCLMELPEIQKLIEGFAASKKNDVLVVALSQDSEPTELAEVRKLVEKTLSEKKITLTGSPVGQIALDPSNSIGNAFEVQGFPTLVILDQKGVVQSVHVGFNPNASEPLHKTLAKEIDTLLDGKSLVDKKPKATEAAKKPGDH
jgi:thiol-disulfide isomerase/thioredoxin